jgi:hypothetical protein
MNTNIEQKKEELRSLAFTDEKINQLLDLATEEAIDIAVADAGEKLSNEELETLAQEIDKPIKNAQDATERLNAIFQAVYKDQAESKKIELIDNYLQDSIDMTKNMKNLAESYAKGDPRAVANVKSNLNTPEAKKIQSIIDNS